MANLFNKIFNFKEQKQEKERKERIARQRRFYGDSIDDILVGNSIFCIPDIENETALVCCAGDEGVKIDVISLLEYSRLTERLNQIENTHFLKSTSESIPDILKEIKEEDHKTVRQNYILEDTVTKYSLATERERERVCSDANVRYSFAPRELTSEEQAEIEARRKELEQELIERERQRRIQERIEELKNAVRQLRDLGLNADEIAKFVQPEKALSRLKVTEDMRIIVPENDNLEIELKPLPRALYILFLKHPEGINFKDLVDYKDEIQSIYNTITNRVHMDKASKSVEDLVDPTNNSVHEKCSRIKAAFMKLFGKAGAEQYAITGKAGEAKSIPAARGFVDWEKK